MNIKITDRLEGKGYIGDMYSVNALLSLEKNEKPIEEWKKSEIVKISKTLNSELDVRLLNKVDSKMMKSKFLMYVGFHHVGADFRNVSFFSIDKDYISNLSNDDIKNLIDESKAIVKNQKIAQKMANESEKQRIKRKLEEKKKRAELGKLLKYSKYKDIQHLVVAVNDGRISVEELKTIQRQCINIKRAELEKKWLEERDFAKLEKIDDDDYIDSFCTGMVK